jgi:hypothetical protein
MSDDLIPQEVLDKAIGFKTGKKIYRVKGKEMVAYALAIGETRPEYVEPGEGDGKPDYSNIIGHPALPAKWAIEAAMGVDSIPPVTTEDGQQVKMEINMLKLLHTAQEYDYTDCVPIKDGDKLVTFGEVAECFIKGSPGKELLWMTIAEETKNQKDELIVRIKVTAGIRKGGYGIKVLEPKEE